MKKKISLILLALTLMVFTLTACNGGTPPASVPDTDLDLVSAIDTDDDTDPTDNPEAVAFAVYTDIMERLYFTGDAASGAFDIDFVMEMDINILGDFINTVSTGNMRTVVDGDTVQAAMIMETDMSEMGLGSMVMETFMVVEDDVVTDLRILMNGEDLSGDLPEEMLELMAESMLDDVINLPDFGMDAFLSAEIDEQGSNTVIHMVLDGQVLGDFVTDAMGDSLDMLGGGFDLGLTVNISDVRISMVIDSDDNPITMTMEMEMIMSFGDDLEDELEELEGEEMSIRAVIEYTFNAFGNDVEIEFAA